MPSQDNQKPDRWSSEFDKAVVQVAAVLLACLALIYAVYFRDLTVALLGGICSYVVYSMVSGSTEDFTKPIRVAEDPLVEAAVVFLVFFDWIAFIASSWSSDYLLYLSGALLFGFFTPTSFLILLRRNSADSIGLHSRRTTRWSELAMPVIVLLSVGLIARLMMYPESLALLTRYDIAVEVALGILTIALVPALTEEFVFRCVIQNRLSLWMRSRTGGLLLTSILFAVLHAPVVAMSTAVPYSDILYPLLNAVLTRLPLGFILGIIWNQSESIVPVFAVHAVNNASYVVLSTLGLV